MKEMRNNGKRFLILLITGDVKQYRNKTTFLSGKRCHFSDIVTV